MENQALGWKRLFNLKYALPPRRASCHPKMPGVYCLEKRKIALSTNPEKKQLEKKIRVKVRNTVFLEIGRNNGFGL